MRLILALSDVFYDMHTFSDKMDHEANDFFHLQRALGKNKAAEYQNVSTGQMEESILNWSSAEDSLLCCEIFCWGLLWADASHEFVLPVITSCGAESKSWCLHGFWLCKTSFFACDISHEHTVKKPNLLENYQDKLIMVILWAIAPSQVSHILNAALEWSINVCIKKNTCVICWSERELVKCHRTSWVSAA